MICLPKKTRSVAIGMVCLVLFGCSNPMNYEVAKLTDQQRNELGQTLNSDQGQKLAGFLVRTALSNKDIPVDMTVAQAIKSQDDWLVSEQVQATKDAELRKRVEAERAAKQQEFAQMLSVVLLSKKDHVQEYEQKFVAFDIAYENKTGKDIQGVKGVLKVADIFGDRIININWSYDGGVAAGKTAVERGSGVSVNQFMEPHMKLWNTDFEKLKTTFEVDTIVFSDGSSVKAPDGTV